MDLGHSCLRWCFLTWIGFQGARILKRPFLRYHVLASLQRASPLGTAGLELSDPDQLCVSTPGRRWRLAAEGTHVVMADPPSELAVLVATVRRWCAWPQESPGTWPPTSVSQGNTPGEGT